MNFSRRRAFLSLHFWNRFGFRSLIVRPHAHDALHLKVSEFDLTWRNSFNAELNWADKLIRAICIGNLKAQTDPASFRGKVAAVSVEDGSINTHHFHINNLP